MSDILNLSLRALAASVNRSDLSAQAVTRAFMERIERLEADVKAWTFIDFRLALAQAEAIDQRGSHGALAGIPVGVKDLMDTADMPSCYGSPIYRGHRPHVDAASVAQCRAAGAVIMGKTVSTEFATFHPGPTHNPRAPVDMPRTPGGSSSGSAAAVAAGMVPVAFGTQTAGSIIRPAAYCGVVGYKPTHGMLPLAGIKPLAPSLDTLGVLTRSVDDAAFFVSVLARTEFPLMQSTGLRVGLCHTPHWEHATPEAKGVFSEAASLLEKAGAKLVDIALPASLNGLTQAQIDIMGREALAAFSPERRTSSHLFSPAFAAFLDTASLLDGTQVEAAYRLADQGRAELHTVFDVVDVLIAPSAEGEAPTGLQATGDPLFNRIWTLLGVPCVHVPIGLGSHGMPLGVTVIGPRWKDGLALEAADQLQRATGLFEG
jgi:Asp-tRNA(Asn)/Glu-tRNA(Gln) amidotransferase A subunit family amidase